jgi:hypothetical protein
METPAVSRVYLGNAVAPVAAARDVVIPRSLTIYPPVHEVFERICDVPGAPGWRDGITVAIQDPPGPLAVGSRLHANARIFGLRVSMEAVVTGFEPDRRWAFEHVSGQVPVSGEFVVEPLAYGTRLTRAVGVREHPADVAPSTLLVVP